MHSTGPLLVLINCVIGVRDYNILAKRNTQVQTLPSRILVNLLLKYTASLYLVCLEHFNEVVKQLRVNVSLVDEQGLHRIAGSGIVTLGVHH